MTEGKLRSGYEGSCCALSDCLVALSSETGAYLHRDRLTGKLALFCEPCSIFIALHASLRFPRVAL